MSFISLLSFILSLCPHISLSISIVEHSPTVHYFLKLQEGKPPAKEKRVPPILYTKLLQERLIAFPPKVRSSLE